MHIRSKFVMVGLSMAVFFTGGYIGHSYFTASDIKDNSITIGSLVDVQEPEPEPDHNCNFDSDAWIHKQNLNNLELILNTPVIGKNDVVEILDYKGYGSVVGGKPTMDGKNAIHINFSHKLDINDIDDKFPSQDYIEITLKFKNGDIVKYRVDFMRIKNGNSYHEKKLVAHWKDLDIKKEPVKEPDEVPPNEIPPSEEVPPGEETPVIPPSEELPPSEGVPELPENPELPAEPETKPENKPEETPQPETPAPPVDEAPSEEPIVE